MRRSVLRPAVLAALLTLLAPFAARAQVVEPPASPHQSRVTRKADGRVIISDILTREDGSKRFIVRHYKGDVLLRRVQIDRVQTDRSRKLTHDDVRRRDDDGYRRVTRVLGTNLSARTRSEYASREHWLTRQAQKSVTQVQLGEGRRIVKRKTFDDAGALTSYRVRYQQVAQQPTDSGQTTRSVFDFAGLKALLSGAQPISVNKVWATKNTAHRYRATFDADGKVLEHSKATYGAKGKGSVIKDGSKRELSSRVVLRQHA
ncbi:MAG: hypothetical protein KC503_10095, partial [Myxococcales bacterium]|nr:hypothetical protein [Myxococcales bacterium]